MTNLVNCSFIFLSIFGVSNLQILSSWSVNQVKLQFRKVKSALVALSKQSFYVSSSWSWQSASVSRWSSSSTASSTLKILWSADLLISMSPWNESSLHLIPLNWYWSIRRILSLIKGLLIAIQSFQYKTWW